MYVDDWKKERKIGISILYLVFRGFQKINKGFTRLKKYS